jgi:hypothetical protein
MRALHGALVELKLSAGEDEEKEIAISPAGR